MAEKTILIIGAGIAGLSAGCYAQMNGYRSQVFELHDLPGGLCTAWERKGYIFDGCIHYLFGTAPGQPFFNIWEELGALKGRPVINHEEFMRVVGPGGRTVVAYVDPDRLEEHIKSISPEDGDLAEDLADGVRTFMDFDMAVMQEKPKALMTPQDFAQLGLKMLPYVGPMAKWGLVSAWDFARRFRDPFLKRAMEQIFGWPDIPMMAVLSLLAYMHKGNAGFPAGGSLEFARAIERRYLELGGVIHYKAQVEKILVEDDRAVGVRLYDDRIFRGDAVISAADGHGTIYDLLGGQYTDRKLDNQYDGRLPLHTQLQVSWGVNRDFSAQPHWVMYLLDEPLLIAGQEYHEIGVKHYSFDPSLAPPGKSCLEIMLATPYAYWQRIYGRKLYDTEQLQVASVLANFLEKLYPGICKDIEVTDVATPLSYERYTCNWQGSSCGWLLTKETMPLMIQGMGKTLPGLKDLYLAGQWVEPGGGVALVAASGRNAVQQICAEDGRDFITTKVPV